MPGCTARLRVGVCDANLPIEVVAGQRSPVLGWRLGNVEAPRPIQVLRFGTTEDRDLVTTIDLLRLPEPIDTSVSCPDVEMPFVDVAGVHARPIACLHRLGIAQGTDDGTRFDPHAPVRRDQMASFLLRTLEQAGVTVGEVDGAATFAGRPLPDGDRWFADVAGVHADAIDRLTAAEITGGDGSGGYGPSASVDRDQLATFLARLLTYLQ